MKTNRKKQEEQTSKPLALLALAIFGTAFLLAGAAPKSQMANEEKFELEFPLGLDEDTFQLPKSNPLTKKKIELGHLLYFDKRLSRDGSIACASCHIPSLAFTDGQPVSQGIKHQQGGRSAPTSINRGFGKSHFWDGRATTLEDQSVGPFFSPVEHGFQSKEELVAKINKIKGYRKLFEEAFGSEITVETIGKAIASFQRTLLSGNSPFDRFDWDGDEKAISESAKRGRKLFFGKARCNLCHFGTNFSDEKFHNIGIGWEGETLDVGRFHVTKKKEDMGAFKTPTLREVSRTAPYMHDGRFPTLMEVVNHYNRGGVKNPFQDNQIIPLELTEEEKKDLVEMLKTLNGEGWQHATAPESFPE